MLWGAGKKSQGAVPLDKFGHQREIEGFAEICLAGFSFHGSMGRKAGHDVAWLHQRVQKLQMMKIGRTDVRECAVKVRRSALASSERLKLPESAMTSQATAVRV